MNRPALSEGDFLKLSAMVRCLKKSPGPARDSGLGARLAEASVFEDPMLGEKIVKMGSQVSLRDLDRAREYSYRLVFPVEASIELGRISILSPLGASLIGRREGESYAYTSPGGLSRVRIEEVRHGD